MKAEITNKITLTETKNMAVLETVKRSLTIKNPKYAQAVKMKRAHWLIDPEIKSYIVDGYGIHIPRGFGRGLCDIAKQYGERIYFVDRRRVLPSVSFGFSGTLRPYQETAINAVLNRDWGTLQSPTGSGKTTMALAIIAKRNQPALVVCHTKELLTQWIDRIESFLGIPKSEIGVIGNGKRIIGDRITVGLVQSLSKCLSDVVDHIGFLIVDECHRCPSRTFSDVVNAFDCRYMLGLSATPWRADGLTGLIYFYLGDKVHEVPARALIADGHICRAEIRTVQTAFHTTLDASKEYSKVLSQLATDEKRNAVIACNAAQAIKESKGISLILSDRKIHCEALQAVLSTNHGIASDVLTGETSNGNRAAIVERIMSGGVRVLIATGQLIGEGFDIPAIETIFLATPIKFSGRLIQYIGRALRPSPGKDHAQIVDFVDSNVGVLAAGAKARRKIFSGMPGVRFGGDA